METSVAIHLSRHVGTRIHSGWLSVDQLSALDGPDPPSRKRMDPGPHVSGRWIAADAFAVECRTWTRILCRINFP